MRLAYLGTPALATVPLRALVEGGHEVVLVVSATDKRRGRGSTLSPSPVKAAALELGLPVTDRIDDLLDLDQLPALGVVVAYGRLIRPHVLAAVPMVNLHFSLLPRWRGAAPVERALLAGDTTTGVCLMAVEEGLDTGGVYRRAEIPVGDATLEELRGELVRLGTDLLLGALAEGLGDPVPQAGEVTYAHKIGPAELQLDWNRPAGELVRLIRLGGAWTAHRGKRLKVWGARAEETPNSVPIPAGDGIVWITEVQPEGRARMPATAWANGARLADGDRLGS